MERKDKRASSGEAKVEWQTEKEKQQVQIMKDRILSKRLAANLAIEGLEDSIGDLCDHQEMTVENIRLFKKLAKKEFNVFWAAGGVVEAHWKEVSSWGRSAEVRKKEVRTTANRER